MFLYFGVYNISAISPHLPIEIKLITYLKERSVKNRAKEIHLPALNEKKLIQKGFDLYQKQCLFCHGAPGDASSRVIRGLNPDPPPLEKTAENWSSREIAWIIQNGFKMTGMPGFKLHLNKEEIHSLTAFIVRFNTLSPKEYIKMQSWREGEKDVQVQWSAPETGWKKLRRVGKLEQGKKLLKSYGCISCHHIPDVPGANGKVGPSLRNWKKRHYIVSITEFA